MRFVNTGIASDIVTILSGKREKAMAGGEAAGYSYWENGYFHEGGHSDG